MPTDGEKDERGWLNTTKDATGGTSTTANEAASAESGGAGGAGIDAEDDGDVLITGEVGDDEQMVDAEEASITQLKLRNDRDDKELQPEPFNKYLENLDESARISDDQVYLKYSKLTNKGHPREIFGHFDEHAICILGTGIIGRIASASNIIRDHPHLHLFELLRIRRIIQTDRRAWTDNDAFEKALDLLLAKEKAAHSRMGLAKVDALYPEGEGPFSIAEERADDRDRVDESGEIQI